MGGEMESSSVRVIAAGALQGQVVIVTGAGTGIGRAIALRLAELGAHVWGLGRHAETLAETGNAITTAGGSYAYEVCDVRDFEGTADLISRIGEEGGIDGLINNAGGQFLAYANDISINGWRAVVSLNLDSIFNLSRSAYPFLARRGGAIVNISNSMVDRGAIGLSHATSARAGVLALSRSLALEWGSRQIRVNCLAPGIVATKGGRSEVDSEIVEDLITRCTPVQRGTLEEEVAESVAFLTSPAGAMITGQILYVDGGGHIGPGVHVLPTPG
jgi:citronellol/citronellal dehydrogenase